MNLVIFLFAKLSSDQVFRLNRVIPTNIYSAYRSLQGASPLRPLLSHSSLTQQPSQKTLSPGSGAGPSSSRAVPPNYIARVLELGPHVDTNLAAHRALFEIYCAAKQVRIIEKHSINSVFRFETLRLRLEKPSGIDSSPM